MREKAGKGGFIKGAAWIAAGGLIAKLIGAAYRIPLTNLIGGRGMGLYQMVYPVYCLLLTVSATGIPSSIAKLTAERLGQGKSSMPLFSVAMKLFLRIGACGTAIMVLVAPVLARVQGAGEVLYGYYALAPSVLLVSAISVFRGWFQGRNDMAPTALSEIAEQVIKAAFGLLFAYLCQGNVPRAVVCLLLAVSVSELAALGLMCFLFYRVPACEKEKESGDRVAAKTVLALSIPVTFSAILLPISSLIDSVLAVRALSVYADDAVTLYGLFAGGAVTIVQLPVSICYGIAAASVPAVSKAVAERAGIKRRLFFSLGITLLVSLPCAFALYALAGPVVHIVFRSLGDGESAMLIALVKTLSVSAVTLSCVQTLSACLTAQGKPKYAALSMLTAVAAKTIAYTIWLKNPKISVFGLAYATNLCYLVAFLLDLVYNLIVSKTKGERKEHDNGSRLGCGKG